MTVYSVLSWAFRQNYHADRMNAAIHCAEVRYSPLTFRLAEWLEHDGYAIDHEQILEVLRDKGRYSEDPGR